MKAMNSRISKLGAAIEDANKRYDYHREALDRINTELDYLHAEYESLLRRKKLRKRG